MTCGRTSPMSQRASFENLAVMFEGSGASGAEQAYKKAVEKLTCRIAPCSTDPAGQPDKKAQKRTAAIYEYCADYDGEWGEIQFDFESGKAEIVRLAEWNKMNFQPFARKVISCILKNPGDELLKKISIPFELYESGGENARFWSWPR